MKNKTRVGAILAILLLGTLTWALNIQPVKTFSKKTCMDDDNQTFYEVRSKLVEVIKHKITTFEWRRLKQRIGVYEIDRDIQQTINGHGLGLRPPTQERWERILEEAYVVDEILLGNQTGGSPSSVDHASSLWFPPIGDQGSEASCVAWAVGYYLKTFQEAKEHGWNLSGAVWENGGHGYPSSINQDRIFSPDFIYHQINGGVDGGCYYSDAIGLVCSIGACSWKKMPNNPADSTSWPSEEAWREAPLYRGNSSGYEYLELGAYDDLTDLKNWIASDQLALIAVDAYKYSSLTSEDIWTLDGYVNPNTNHANTIVGYDNNIEYTEEGVLRHGAFKIANSWGKGGWENIPDGCYWISYEAMKQHVGYCMFYQDRIDYDPRILASFRMDHAKRGECSITFGIGNESAPIQTKRFDEWTLNGGNHPFCACNIVLDITEFEDTAPTIINQSFFIEVYDGGTSTTGIISSFSIEHYSSYVDGALCTKGASNDVPVSTKNQDSVFAGLILHESLPGDINYDGIVDIFDAVIVALAFGTRPGDPYWNPVADLNRDHLIDIFDIVVIAINYGTRAYAR